MDDTIRTTYGQCTGPEYDEIIEDDKEDCGGTNAGKRYRTEEVAKEAMDALCDKLEKEFPEFQAKYPTKSFSIKKRVNDVARLYNNIGTGLMITSNSNVVKAMKKLYDDYPIIAEIKQYNSDLYDTQNTPHVVGYSRCEWCGMTQDEKTKFYTPNDWNGYINVCDYCS
jgi:hypothetical protein